MTSFLNLKEDDRRLHIATMLGFSPNHPDSWPSRVIDRLIKGSEDAAERHLREAIMCIVSDTTPRRSR